MNSQPMEYKNKKYAVKSAKISHVAQYNLTKEEVAESVIRSLGGAIEDMKSGVRRGSARDLVARIRQEISEGKTNGQC